MRFTIKVMVFVLVRTWDVSLFASRVRLDCSLDRDQFDPVVEFNDTVSVTGLPDSRR